MSARVPDLAPGAARGRHARRGAALVVALATLSLLMALAIALHAVTLRERRSALRATLVRAAMDGAEGALARWQVELARGEPSEALADLAGAAAGGVPGAARVLEGGGDAPTGQGIGGPLVRVRVTLVTLGAGARMLVSDATAGGAPVRARRRVSLLLVPDTLGALPGDTAAGAPRPRLVPAPGRAWAELP